jgi:glyoxylase-like metal-dependent hydrolase (beta-lactamase superfamily II)
MNSGRKPVMVTSRRSFLMGTAALVSSGSIAAGARQVYAASGVHQMKVGAAEITILSDGVFSMPRSMVLPETPAAEVEALFAAHGANIEIVAETNVTLVRNGPVLALLDTGAGPDFMPTLGKLTDRLEALGIGAGDITHVVFTHAHADHFWGALDPFEDGSRWPKARHVMSATERDFWLTPGIEDKVPAFQKSMAVGIQRRMKLLADVIQPATPGAEVAPGIALVGSPGHTPGHVSVAVRSGTDEILVAGDALTHAAASFGAPQWIWGSDLDGQQAAVTRGRLLDDLSARKVRLIGYHLPWPGAGRVERKGTAFRFVPG